MFDVGRLCVKIAGRDAGKTCVVVEVLDRTYVLVDGETRRRKCNIAHLEPLNEMVDIQKGASHEAVSSALKKGGIDARETKPKQAASKPTQTRIATAKPATTPKAKKAKAEKAPSAKKSRT
jgi:large subunit ribosomal protein L14e